MGMRTILCSELLADYAGPPDQAPWVRVYLQCGDDNRSLDGFIRRWSENSIELGRLGGVFGERAVVPCKQICWVRVWTDIFGDAAINQLPIDPYTHS